jgi:ribonuclease Z
MWCVSIHTTPEEAGKIVDRVKPKLAVYTHVGLVGGPAGRAVLAGELVPRLEVGEDLMTIVIGDRVSVSRATTPTR